jgi:hypothetical protein
MLPDVNGTSTITRLVYIGVGKGTNWSQKMFIQRIHHPYAQRPSLLSSTQQDYRVCHARLGDKPPSSAKGIADVLKLTPANALDLPRHYLHSYTRILNHPKEPGHS